MDQLTIHRKLAYFWSDTHFWHRRLSELRGYSDPADMNNALVAQVLTNVPPDVTIILLGDISFAGSVRTLEVLERMPQKKVLVRGNHDKAMNARVLQRFESVHSLLTVKVTGDAQEDGGLPLLARIVCCHFPMLSWDMQHHGAWHLHGHSHGNMRYPWPDAKILDVGVDTPLGKYGPVGFDMIQEYMDRRCVRSSDHHQPGGRA